MNNLINAKKAAKIADKMQPDLRSKQLSQLIDLVNREINTAADKGLYEVKFYINRNHTLNTAITKYRAEYLADEITKMLRAENYSVCHYFSDGVHMIQINFARWTNYNELEELSEPS